MQILKTVFWVVLAGLIVLFSAANWKPIDVNLWGDLQIHTVLPIVVIVAFLAGSLPFWALHRISRWSMRRKLDSAERALASVKPPFSSAPASTSTDFSSSQSDL